MRRCSSALALAALLMPVAARAEPVSVTLQSASSGFTWDSNVTSTGLSIDLGELSLDAGSSAIYLFDGLDRRANYTVSFSLEGARNFTAEVLDPVDGDDSLDPADQPSYVPDGYSTSNTRDGFSFAQSSGIERSAVFLGGSGTVTADEMTDRGDALMFAGLNGAEDARVTFGLRDYFGERGFLLRLSADPAPIPEPASMFLIGSGLLGLAAYRRRSSAKQ